MEKALEGFTKIYNTNMQAFGKAFAMTDGHVYVLNRMIQDIVKSCVYYSPAYMKWQSKNANGVPYPGEDVFDLAYYFGEFNKMQERKMKEAQQKSQDAPAKNAEEFGGDYGQATDGSESAAPEGDKQGASEGDGHGRDAQDPVSALQESVGALD
jgi:hypothetical protein